LGLLLVLSGCTSSSLQPLKDLGSPGAATASGPASAGTAASLTGRILDEAGTPVAGVRIDLFAHGADVSALVAIGAGGLVGNAAAGLAPGSIGTTTSGLAAPALAVRRVHALPPSATTDAAGVFRLAAPGTGSYNVAAVDGARGTRAWRSKVVVTSGDTSALVGDLVLRPPGTIVGRVTLPAAPEVTNIEGVEVFVPGLSYTARCDRTGSFTISNVAAGAFDLVARQLGLGRGERHGLEVTPSQAKQVGDLPMVSSPPVLAGLSPAVAAVGETVTLSGRNLGASEGLPVTVTVGGLDAVRTQRLSDTMLQFTVPRGAISGEVQVQVGGLRSAVVDLPLYDTLANDFELSDLTLLPEATLSLRAFGMLGDTLTVPELEQAWSVEGDAAAISGRTLVARNPGRVTLTVRAGTLSASLSVLVVSSDAVMTTPVGLGMPGYRDGALKEAQFSEAYGLATMADGRIILADGGNNRVRGINLLTGFVTTLAGSNYVARPLEGTVQFHQPRGVAVDANGRVYVADYYACSIRVVEGGWDGGTVSTIGTLAGRPDVSGMADGKRDQALFAGPNALFWMPDGSLLVTDKLNNSLRRVTLAGEVTTLVGDGRPGRRDGPRELARLELPRDAVALDDGSLWIVDRQGTCTRRLADGRLRTLLELDRPLETPYTTVAGIGHARDLRAIAAICRGPDGSLNALAGGTRGESDGAGAQGRFFDPAATTVLPDGDLLVSDTGSGTMRRIRLPAELRP